MLFFQVSLNVLLLFGLIMLPAALTVLIIKRRSRVLSLQSKLAKVEKELLASYAEILELQREKANLELKIRESSIPVIPISTAKEDKLQETLPDVSPRKKLLGQQAVSQNS